MRADVPGITEEQFGAFTTTAMRDCLISRLLTVEPTMTTTLLSR